MNLNSTRKFSLIFSALLIGNKYLGLVVEGKIPYTEITISSSANITVLLTILSSFFIINYVYYWFKEEKDNRHIFEFTTTLAIGFLAIISVVYAYLVEYGIDWKVVLSSILLLLIGTILGVTVDFTIAIFLSIRSDKEMRKLGLGRLPSASKAFIRSLFLLIPLNSIVIFLLVKYQNHLPNLTEKYWYIFYLSPAFLMNFDYLSNSIKCIGPAKIRKKAIKELRFFRKAMDMHEMHYQYIGLEPLRNYEKPPICEQAELGNLKIVEQLLIQGVDPNVQDGRGWTPLMWAAAERHSDVVDKLLEHGADPNLVNYLGRLAIGYAANYGLYEICKMLIDKGATLNPSREFSDTPPLFLAASKGHLEVVKLLVNSGADIFHKSRGEHTALDIAMREGHGEVAKYLRNEMAELEEDSVDKTDFVKNTEWLTNQND